MNTRQRIRAALRGESPDRIPVICRLDVWHRTRQVRGDWPADYGNISLEDLQRKLGMGVSARSVRPYQSHFAEPVRYDTSRDDDRTIETWTHPEGTLQRITQDEPGNAAIGIKGRIVRYPIASRDDYRLFEKIISHLRFSPNVDALRDLDARVGDDGLPLGIIGACPAHDIIGQWVGYEQAFIDLFDMPDVFAGAAAAMEAAYRSMWDIVADAPCELVMHGVNFDSQMTSPPVFERYMLPYLAAFNDRMHAAGKRNAFHGDGNMTALLSLVLDAGFDVADCLATQPLTPLDLDDAFAAWDGRITVWGGVPSPILEATYPAAQFAAFMDNLRRQTEGRTDFICGIADQAMPDSLFGRLQSLSATFA